MEHGHDTIFLGPVPPYDTKHFVEHKATGIYIKHVPIEALACWSGHVLGVKCFSTCP